jgi:hypothetical protein
VSTRAANPGDRASFFKMLLEAIATGTLVKSAPGTSKDDPRLQITLTIDELAKWTDGVRELMKLIDALAALATKPEVAPAKQKRGRKAITNWFQVSVLFYLLQAKNGKSEAEAVVAVQRKFPGLKAATIIRKMRLPEYRKALDTLPLEVSGVSFEQTDALKQRKLNHTYDNTPQ